MKSIKSRWLVAALALCIGCVPSLYPIYTDKDLIFEPALLGTWGEADADETWTFSAHAPRSYRLVVRHVDGTEGVFVAHLAEFGGSRFLDLLPEESDDRLNEFYAFHLLRVHTFYHVEQIEPRLRLSYMDPDWISKFVEENPRGIKHETIDDRVVLTASTDELQNFFKRQIETPGAFSEPTAMARVEN